VSFLQRKDSLEKNLGRASRSFKGGHVREAAFGLVGKERFADRKNFPTWEEEDPKGKDA